jgi:hypothetical protein
MKGKKLKWEEVEQINELIKVLKNAPMDADTIAKKYSDNSISKMAFEVGYLNGYCKTAADILENIIK